jgi:hypothetical protein
MHAMARKQVKTMGIYMGFMKWVDSSSTAAANYVVVLRISARRLTARLLCCRRYGCAALELSLWMLPAAAGCMQLLLCLTG